MSKKLVQIIKKDLETGGIDLNMNELESGTNLSMNELETGSTSLNMNELETGDTNLDMSEVDGQSDADCTLMATPWWCQNDEKPKN